MHMAEATDSDLEWTNNHFIDLLSYTWIYLSIAAKLFQSSFKWVNVQSLTIWD